MASEATDSIGRYMALQRMSLGHDFVVLGSNALEFRLYPCLSFTSLALMERGNFHRGCTLNPKQL